MSPAHYYWNGNYEGMAQAIVDRCPHAIRVLARDTMKRTAVDELESDATFNLYRTYNVSEEINAVAGEAADRAVTAMERLHDVVKEFRNNTRNDLASMKAQSDRVQTEVNTMTANYKQAVMMLTSPEFIAAMQNAERFAAAMRAINELQATRVVLQMFDNVDVKGIT